MSHILVVEDDVQFREMLVQMLRLDGHEVAIATDGLEALQRIQRSPPDLIITDILMPKMDGVETIIELARRGIDIPIIAMSGGRRMITAEFNLESAELLDVAATLSKPFSRADLRKAIAGALLTSRVASRIAS
jgi:CheY-like chemotaxis protein